MKNIAAFLVIALFLTACEEEPPFINYEKSSKLLDSTYVESSVATPQQKTVLIEDVSGVRCINCPDAAVVVKNIMAQYPDRVFSTVMHPTGILSSLVEPVTKTGHKSKYDFRTNDAKIILESRIGVPNSLPSGAINRRLFSGTQSRLLGRQDWFAKTQEELQGTTPVNVEVKSKLNPITGEGVATVTLKYTAAVSEPHYLSLLLIEDSIIDVQESQNQQTGEVEYLNDYNHMHVFRDAITAPTGDLIANDKNMFTAGRVFVKQYAFKLNVSDKIKVKGPNAKLIAFVHKDNLGIEILQVAETHVTDH